MTHCPDCRSPILSLMMLDARNEPEYYCEHCAVGYPIVDKIASAPPKLVAA
jgi:uncharacterized protein YbaR (Trm112 family)